MLPKIFVRFGFSSVDKIASRFDFLYIFSCNRERNETRDSFGVLDRSARILGR